jgi:predicted permease
MRWRRRKRDEDLEREVRSHLEAEAEELRESGLAAEEAHYAARRAFGNTALAKETVRETWEWNWLERFKQDVAYALRAFGRTPGFTAVVILTLALGIGATTAIFSIVNAVLLNPLPYPNADRLVVIWEKLVRNPKGTAVFDSYRDFETWKNASRSFELLAPATWATGGQILIGNGAARNVLAMPVGIDFFPLLGATPELGRTFQPDDLHRGCTVVLKHSFWLAAFGGQKDVVGKHVSLSEQACTVTGVMPAGFTFYPDAASMWMLITPDSAIGRDPENANVGVFGRLKPGVSIERAQKEVEALYRNQHKKDPDGIVRIPAVFPLAEQFAYLSGPTLRLSVMILFGAVIFVLLIACVNIANLLLGRSLARQKELAVRAALGSGRMRLIRQLLTEGLLLSFAGASIGVLLALGAVHYFRILNPIQMPPGNPVSVDVHVLGFTAGLAVATALAFGLAPALKASRVDLIDALRASGRSASLGPTAQAFGKTLVAAEVMLSLTLLVGAGLLIESVNRLSAVPLGFRTDHLLSVPIELPEWSYSKDARRISFYREVLNRTKTLPGVESAALASSLPLTSERFGASALAVEGKPAPDAKTAPNDVTVLSVTPDYFRVMGVSLEQGRFLDDGDQAEREPVAIVNEALVRKYFPRENPVGKRIQVGKPGSDRPWLTIAGVAANEKDKDFFHEMNWEEIPLVFRPVAQAPPLRVSLVVRTAGDNLALGAAIQKQIAALDNSVPVGEVEPMNKRLSHVLAYPRFRAIVLGTFAGLAVLLAGVGLYGVLSQLIAQRTQEFGVRIALGAQKRDVLTMVLRQGLLLTAAGLAAGLAVAFCLAKFLSSLLYGVNAADPLTLAGVSTLLLLVAFLATYLPARRAAGIDPMSVLRHE